MSLSIALKRLDEAGMIVRSVMERLCSSIVMYVAPAPKTAAAKPLGELSMVCEQLCQRQRALGQGEAAVTMEAARPSALTFDPYQSAPPLQRVLSEAIAALAVIRASGEEHDLVTIDAPSEAVLKQLLRVVEDCLTGPSSEALRTCPDWASDLSLASPSAPVRINFVERPIDATPWRALATSPRGRAQILHDMYIDIEISAMEVCARNVLCHPAMPLDFVSDMSRQIWDESRHAVATLRRCDALGGPLEGRFYSLKLHHRWESGDDLVTRLFIEQLVQEGNSLDSVAQLGQLFADAGDHTSADILAFLAADEELHAWIGNRWVLTLLRGNLDEYRRKLAIAAAIVGVAVPGPSRLAIERRIRAGFPAALISEMYEAQSTGSRSDMIHRPSKEWSLQSS